VSAQPRQDDLEHLLRGVPFFRDLTALDAARLIGALEEVRYPAGAVIAEEGARSLYGGLSAHLMRVVPNAAVMYSIYEGVLRWGVH